MRKMSHCAKKRKKGDTLRFVSIHSVAKYRKTRKRGPFETLKNICTLSKKLEGGPFSLVRFCRLR